MKANGIYEPCAIEHCPKRRRKLSPVCASCASSFRYWMKKDVGAILGRQKQLEKWQDRMQYLGTEVEPNRRFRNAARIIEKRRA